MSNTQQPRDTVCKDCHERGMKRLACCTIRRLRMVRVTVLTTFHAVLFAVIYWAAFGVRFDFNIPESSLDVFLKSTPALVGIKLVVFYVLRQCHSSWRHVTFADFVRLLQATGLALLIIAAVDHFVFSYQIPRSIPLIDALITILVLGSLRSSWRLFRENGDSLFGNTSRENALLVGADMRAARLATSIHADSDLPYRICGFVTNTGSIRVGTRLGQIPVLGMVDQLEKIAMARQVTTVLVIAGSLPGNELRSLMETCNRRGLLLKIMPPMDDLFDGNHHIPLRDININDLLRRNPVELDVSAIGEMLAGSRVLVTGAGGSIGSEICRQVLKFQPAELILLGRGENRIFFLDRELQSLIASADPDTASHPRTKERQTEIPPQSPVGRPFQAVSPHSSSMPDACDQPTKLIPVIGDITDATRMRQVFEEYRPQVVFHAAAHKHVPLMEANVGEAIKNNVFGTRNVADLADEYDVRSFVLISSDKAVNPTSVMGATKHLAERYVNALSQESSTRFVVVRFGNVLGSAGSVVPLFQEQIRKGGPITITDERMVRYFMTIPEASQLVLQAASMGKGGEIFVLDMGNEVKIIDLARDLVTLSGLPLDSIEIVATGIRPGEKLYEELYFTDERTLETAHPKLRVAAHRQRDYEEVCGEFQSLEHGTSAAQNEQRALLRELITEFTGHTKPTTTPQSTAASSL